MTTTAQIRGLTLIRPWGFFVAEKHKPVENRTWKPPAAMLGGFVAIHNGQKYDPEAVGDIEFEFGLTYPGADRDPSGHIIAVARLAAVTHEDEPNADRSSRWFCGPFGWWLADVVRIAPVPCKGAQGLWVIPPPVLEQVRANWKAATAEGAPP